MLPTYSRNIHTTLSQLQAAKRRFTLTQNRSLAVHGYMVNKAHYLVLMWILKQNIQLLGFTHSPLATYSTVVDYLFSANMN